MTDMQLLALENQKARALQAIAASLKEIAEHLADIRSSASRASSRS